VTGYLVDIELKMEVYFMTIKQKFKKMVYHVQYDGGDHVRVSGYFTDLMILLIKVGQWSNVYREWKYWVTGSDMLLNNHAEFEWLPVLCLGWYDWTCNGYVFNCGDEL